MAKRGMRVAEALKHLDVTTDVTEKELKQAYKDLARIWHPDRFQNDVRLEAKAEEQIKVINEAKTVALNYLKKHGHFRFVGREKPQRPQYQTASQQQAPEKEKPKEKAEPKAKPKSKPEPEPKHEPKYESEPEENVYWESDDDSSFSDYVPGQNILISAILLVVLVGFLFIMFSSFDNDTPKDRVEAYLNKKDELKTIPQTKKPVVSQELEADSSSEIEEEEPESAYIDTFFTLGSDKEWVSLVQGPPFQIKSGVWRYGFSSIRFKGDKVIGWNSSELNPLSIGMLPDSNWADTLDYFYIGSPRIEVAALQGAPDILDGNNWSYGEAQVRFDADTVVFWKNDIRNTLLAEELEEFIEYEADE